MPPTLLPLMAAHVAWTALLYILLTIARAPKVWGLGRRADGSSPWASVEPRISANLSNQFEWPVFFHVGCLVLMQQGAVSAAAVALGWAFILGRVAHSAVQIGTPQVRLRGLVFTINFLATLGLWALVVRA